MIEFCPHCKKVLVLEKMSGNVALICVRCGYTTDASKEIVVTSGKSERSVFVIEKQQQQQPRRVEEY